MTVKQLSELLQEYDDDLEVRVTFDAGCGITGIVGVHDHNYAADRAWFGDPLEKPVLLLEGE